MFCVATLVAVFLASIPMRAAADDKVRDQTGSARLVNVESATTTLKGAVTVGADVRFLDNPENLTYTSAELRYGLLSNIEMGIAVVATEGARGSTSRRRAPSSESMP